MLQNLTGLARTYADKNIRCREAMSLALLGLEVLYEVWMLTVKWVTYRTSWVESEYWCTRISPLMECPMECLSNQTLMNFWAGFTITVV